MKIKVTVERSPTWVTARRIETGENVARMIDVEVEAAELSTDSRQKLMSWQGEYCDIDRITFGSDYKPSRCSIYGYRNIKIDADAPTTEQVDQAIMGAFAEIEQERIKWEQEKLERAEREEEERKQKELDKWWHDKAKEILKDDIERLKQTEEKLELLSEFVHQVPDDACRVALKALAKKRSLDSLKDLQKQIEDAAVNWVVFDEDNDDEEEKYPC